LVRVRVGDRYDMRLRNEVNVYTFTLPWKKPNRSQAPIVKMASKLPYPQDIEKNGSLLEEIRTAEKGLRFCTPGSDAYITSLAKLERLRLMAHGEGGETVRHNTASGCQDVLGVRGQGENGF